MRTTIGVLGIVGLGVSLAVAQPPAAVRPRGATLLPPTAPDPTDLPLVARAVAEDVPAAATTPVTSSSGFSIRPDPSVAQAGGIQPAAPGAVVAPAVPSTDNGALLGRKLKNASSAQPSPDQPNASTPFRSTTATGSTVYAGPPAYRWYGWGTVTPGANPYAPSGQYPKASANWYSITGASPGAFPVPVTNAQQVAAGPEPPSYAQPGRPGNTYTSSAPAITPMQAPDLMRPSNPNPRAFAPPPVVSPQPVAATQQPQPVAPPFPPPGSLGMTATATPPPAAPSYPAAPTAPTVPAVPVHADVDIPGVTTHLPPGPIPQLPQAPTQPHMPASPADSPTIRIEVPATVLPPVAEISPNPALPAPLIRPTLISPIESPTSVSPVGPVPAPVSPVAPQPMPIAEPSLHPADGGLMPLPPPMSLNSPTEHYPPVDPAPAALPVSVTDYQLKWQPTTDTQGQWTSPGKNQGSPKSAGPLPVKETEVPFTPASAPAVPLPVLPALVPSKPAPNPSVPLLVVPASAPPAPAAKPTTPMPAPDWDEPGTTQSDGAKPIARGQIGPATPDPILTLVKQVCVGRAEGLDVRFTGSKRLSVCFECHTANEGKVLVKDISARPELVPYRIDFCVLVK